MGRASKNYLMTCVKAGCPFIIMIILGQMTQSLDIYIATMISSSNSIVDLYKEYGVVIDGVWKWTSSYYDHIRLKDC